MPSATPKRVRLTARENSPLYHLQLQFNLLLPWFLVHVHPGTLATAPTPTLQASGLKQIGNESGRNVDGTALSQSGANLITVGLRRARPESFVYEMVKLWNASYDILAAHGHPGAGQSPSVLVNELANFDKRSPAGVDMTPGTPSITSARWHRMEGTDETELIIQWNQMAQWYWNHGHSAAGVAATLAMDSGVGMTSKIADYEGKDIAGAVVTV